MGEVNAASGRVVAAERNFKDAVDLDKKLFGDDAPTASAELQLGAFYAGEQLYAPALAAYREAFASSPQQGRASQVVADQSLPYFDAGGRADPKTAALDNEMFGAAQLVGAGVADQTIARMAAREAAGTPALAEPVRAAQDAQRARDTARIELAAENAKADEDRDAKRVQTLQAEFTAASKQYDALAAKLAQSFPAYGKLAAPGPASLSDVQRELAPDAALVMFVVGVEGKLCAARHAGRAHRAPAYRHLGDALPATSPICARRSCQRWAGVAPFSLKCLLRALSEAARAVRADLSGRQSLIVVPSPELASLPFALLVTQAPAANGNYSDAAWLIRRMAVSSVPQPARVCFAAQPKPTRSPAPDPILAFGAPAFTGRQAAPACKASRPPCRDGGPVPAGMLRALPPLPDTAGEVNAVGACAGRDADSLLLGAARHRAALRAHKLSDYSVLYFATHGLLPGELHCQSEPALVLSPPATCHLDRHRRPADAREIADLNLNADLVVLSACNTATGGTASRRQRARGPGRRLLRCRRARGAGEPLGGAVGADRHADDGPVRALSAPHRAQRPGAGAAPVAACADRASPRRPIPSTGPPSP